MQMYKRLFIFVEGDDDTRFFDTIVKPLFERKYNYVKIWDYAQELPKRIRRFINSINAMSADYIFTTDINDAPCITYRKERKRDKYKNIDKDKIVVVIREIESWYLAGLDGSCCRKFRIPSNNTTDSITKEKFDNMIPKKFASSRVDYCHEILKYFQVKIAKQKNESFRYFLEDFLEKYAYG